MDKPSTLTGNDVALAASACALAMAWWREQPKSQWGKARIAELDVLSKKLQALGDAAYPHVRYCEDEGFNAPDSGDEPIMRLDGDVLAMTTKLGVDEVSAEANKVRDGATTWMMRNSLPRGQ